MERSKDTNYKNKLEFKVPSNINIYLNKYEDKLSLGFNRGKSIVRYSKYGFTVIDTYDSIDVIQHECYLKKVRKGNCKDGDLLFRSNRETLDVKNINYYCISKKDDRYTFVSESGEVRRSDLEWKHWYKVIIKK